MTAKKGKKVNNAFDELAELLSFKDDEERIDVKASFIQLDILDEVKKIMKEKNISRTELAEKLKKSKSFVSQLFSGDKALNLKMIAQFQEIFDAKFIPSFKDYSEYLTTKDFSKNIYIRNNENEGWEQTTPIFDLAKYQEENKAA